MAGYTSNAIEVAKEITIAFKDKLMQTRVESAESLNESLGEAVAKFYEQIYNKVIEVSQK